MQSIKLLILFSIILSIASEAEWTNRYPKVDGQRHHIYLESYELPILSSGPKYPAPSPDGRSIAFASYGWIWVLEIQTGIAKRITDSSDIDGRPRWSADGSQLTFVRDSGLDSSIIVLDLASCNTNTINTPAIDLDPEFSADGTSLYFSSAESGLLNIWKYNLNDSSKTMITDLDGHSRNPRLSADGKTLYFSHLDWPNRQIRSLHMDTGKQVVIKTDSIAGQFSFDLHPQRDLLSYNWAVGDDLNLTIVDVNESHPVTNITPGRTYVQDPAWSRDGKHIYYSEPNNAQQFKLMEVSAFGGSPQQLPIKNWDWGEKTATLKIITSLDNRITPSRLSVRDATGHALVSPDAGTYFDSENGQHFFYSDGEIELQVPLGEIRVTATQGLMSAPMTQMINVKGDTKIDVRIKKIWNASDAGYHSADFHLHLNYDGPYRHVTSDIEPLIAGEDLDIATPQAANLHNRLMDKEFLGETLTTSGGALIKFAQEVRSHFHGHIGVVGPTEFYFPWFWGPGYPKLNNGNLSNSTVFDFVDSFDDSIGTYVHPVAYNVNPFNYKKASSIPVEFIPDAILSDNVGLELVCAWSDELGTSELWYRLLNIGRPVVAMAGTDMFVDFHRTPAVGSARVYAQQDQDNIDWRAFIAAVKQGRTFVTNGPALLLKLEDKAQPGDLVKSGSNTFRLKVISALAVDNVELVINGEVVWSGGNIAAGESKTFEGTIDLPEGGWIAARAHGGVTSWPSMDSYPFAHTSPIWINQVGSTDKPAKQKASRELRIALNQIEERARLAYEGDNISRLLERIDNARNILEQ